MIHIVLGNLGSGKTASIVRNMVSITTPIYTNIRTKKLSHVHVITPDMLIQDKVIGHKRNGEEIIKKSFNKQFWQETVEEKGNLHIVLDEFHLMMDARRPSSTINKIMADFLAMGRRVAQHNPTQQGSLTLITQLERRIDIVSKEMATNVQWTRAHKQRTCSCGFSRWVTNEDPIQYYTCSYCKKNTKESQILIEVWLFTSYRAFELFYYGNKKTYYYHGFIKDIHKYFSLYNTVQWEDMFEGYY